MGRALRTFPALVVSGPRQAGKTTLLRSAFGTTHRYASLDEPDIRARAVADPVGFLRQHAPPVILDEIQQVPSLLPYIKTRIDEDRSPGRCLLSGSQVFPLMAGVTEPLAGALVETVVIAEWTRAFRHRGESVAMSFFRTADGLEIDLVIERNGRIYAGEVKATATVTPTHANALRRFRDLTGSPPVGVLFADVPRSCAVAPGVVARPWWSLASL